MHFHFVGKYNGDPASLPSHPHEAQYVPFDEPEDLKDFAKIANGLAIAIYLIGLPVLVLRGGWQALHMMGILAFWLTLIPHEVLHALCFKGDVYMYTDLKKGLLFVIGPEVFTKKRFVFMSLLPNLVFGIMPFMIFLIDPSQGFLGTLGLFSLTAGAGDYINIYNALTQMPRGALTYMNGTKSYWFIPAVDT